MQQDSPDISRPRPGNIDFYAGREVGANPDSNSLKDGPQHSRERARARDSGFVGLKRGSSSGSVANGRDMSEETIRIMIIAIIGPVSAFMGALFQKRFMADEFASREFVDNSLRHAQEFWFKFSDVFDKSMRTISRISESENLSVSQAQCYTDELNGSIDDLFSLRSYELFISQESWVIFKEYEMRFPRIHESSRSLTEEIMYLESMKEKLMRSLKNDLANMVSSRSSVSKFVRAR